MRLAITRWRNLVDPVGESGEIEWSDLVAELSTRRDFRGDREHPGWSPARLDPVERAAANVRAVSALCLDYDAGSTLDAAAGRWGGLAGLLHTTRKHTPDAPRFRVVLPLSRTVSAFEFAALWRRVNATVGGVIDQAPKDASRFWYLPGCPPDAEFIARELRGGWLDVDAWLAKGEPATAAPAHVPTNTGTDVERRAIAYIARMPESISGSGGHGACWSVALVLAKGFALGERRTYEILRDHYNARCSPPWSDVELRHKANQAAAARVAEGYKLGDRWEPERVRPHEPAPSPEWSDVPDDDLPPDFDGDEVAPEPTPEPESPFLSMADLMQLVVLELQKPKPEKGLPTGFPRIDRAIGGMRGGNITVVGAKRGFGKTSLGNAILKRTIVDHDCALFAGEDPAMMYGKRFLADAANLNALALRDLDRPTEAEWEAIANAMQSAPARPFFCVVGSRPVEWIAEQIVALGKRTNLRLVIVDYLQCLSVARKQQDRRNEVTYITKTLCDAIRSVGAAGILFSQLKRTERTEAEVEDLKESGDIEDKADHILLGWKDDAGQGESKARRFLKLAKNKDGQDAADFRPVELYFDPKTASFRGEIDDGYETVGRAISDATENYDGEPWEDR